MNNKRLMVSLLAGIMALVLVLSLILGLFPRANAKTTSSAIKEQIENMENEQKEMQAQNQGSKVNLMKIIPWFIGGFLLLAVLNSVGAIPAAISAVLKSASKFLMVAALAAIGLNTSLLDFKKAGLAPMFYGVTIDTLVTLTALIVIWCMGLM